MLRFKPTFSLSSFTFIMRLFSLTLLQPNFTLLPPIPSSFMPLLKLSASNDSSFHLSIGVANLFFWTAVDFFWPTQNSYFWENLLLSLCNNVFPKALSASWGHIHHHACGHNDWPKCEQVIQTGSVGVLPRLLVLKRYLCLLNHYFGVTFSPKLLVTMFPKTRRKLICSRRYWGQHAKRIR